MHYTVIKLTEILDNINTEQLYKFFDWKRSSGWLESWEGLLLVTGVLKTCAGAIFRVKSPGFKPFSYVQVLPSYEQLFNFNKSVEWQHTC